MLSTVAALVVAVVAAVASGPVDAGTVQAAYVYELDAAGKCASVIDPSGPGGGGRVCGALRRFELKGIDRARGLTLVNENLKGALKGCSSKPTHAFVFETTRGLRAVDVSFTCHTLGGRQLSNKSEKEIASFFRLYGLVNGLGAGL